MPNKTEEELRKTPAHVVCEHKHSQRSCPHCEILAMDDELEVLRQHSKILLELIDRGFMDHEGIDTATDEMIEAGVVPKGWTIHDVRLSHGLQSWLAMAGEGS